MTYSKYEEYHFKQDEVSRKFVNAFIKKLTDQNISTITCEDGCEIRLSVCYPRLSVSDESILESEEA